MQPCDSELGVCGSARCQACGWSARSVRALRLAGLLPGGMAAEACRA